MTQKTFTRIVRAGLFVIGIIGLAETAGFFFLQSWARAQVPWDLDRMAGIFLASICAAASLPILWIALTEEYAALTAGAINFAIMFAGFAAFSFQVYTSNPRPAVLIFGLFSAIGALATFGLIFFGIRHEFQHKETLPPLMRYSFAVFAINLLIAGAMLVLKRPHVFPWQLTPQQSVLYGWIFLGAAAYFVHALLRPVWSNTYGQLLGFLAYDLILIGPFIAMLFGSEAFLLPNLVYYILVLFYSGGLAVYYLWIHATTRISFKKT